MTFDVRSTVDFVDSTTFDQQQAVQPDSVPDTNGLLTPALSPNSNSIFHLGTTLSLQHDLQYSGRLSAELLTKSVAEGHAKTCLLTTEQIVDMMRKPQDVVGQSFHFKNLVSARWELLLNDVAQNISSNTYSLSFSLFMSDRLNLVTRTVMARMCPEVDINNTADNRVRKNGSWFHEVISRWSDRTS